jgi:hypothetical protein
VPQRSYNGRCAEGVAPDLQDRLVLSSRRGTGVGKTRSPSPPTTERGEREERTLTTEEPSATLALDDPQINGNRRQITMRATVMYEAGDVRVEDVPDAKILASTAWTSPGSKQN